MPLEPLKSDAERMSIGTLDETAAARRKRRLAKYHEKLRASEQAKIGSSPRDET